MTEQKPREFWINDGRVFLTEKEATTNFGEVYKTIYPIHLIEYSAITTLEEKVRELEQYNANCISLNLHESRMAASESRAIAAEEKLAKAVYQRNSYLKMVWEHTGQSLKWPLKEVIENYEKEKAAADATLAEIKGQVK